MQFGAPASSRARSFAPRVAAVFFAAMAAAYWLSPGASAVRPAPVPTWSPPPVAASNGPDAMREQIQALLAQGGCPGWMALAGEPDLLNGQGHEPTRVQVYDGPFVATASQVVDQAAPPAALAPDDELIPESEDLLFNSPGVEGSADATEAEEAEQPTPLPAVEEPSAPAEATTADQAPPPDSAAPTEPAPPSRELSPQELLRELPIADESAPPAQPPSPPRPQPVRDLLNDHGDLLAPAPTPAPPPPTGEVVPRPAGSTFAPPPTGIAPLHGAAQAPPGAAPTDAESRCTFHADSQYPSATACRTCHEKVYEEWSVSSHAYAAVSPMFHKFEQKINDLSQGTIGYFCFRCHSPAGTALGVSRAAPLWDMPAVAREGVTCVACHRVREMYGKTNGERRIEPGDIYAPVYGSIGGDGVAAAIAQKEQLKVKISPDEKGPGQPMHSAGFCFPQLSKAEFCTSCHQVAVYPGIKLEVVWEQYRASPACKKGVSCQDCHMGRIPGVPSGYEVGPAAEINKKNVNAQRKHANHTFYGPGYSIAHPGIFPINPKAERWSMRDWLLFEWRAGWGTDEFEDAVDDGRVRVDFPVVWKESDDRYDAREIIDANLKKKQAKDSLRVQVMENGSAINGPFFDGPRSRGVDLNFHYDVANTNDGHNLPTGSLGAQPQLWANVVLIGPCGERLWESGYLDSQGDLADIHSDDVRHKRAPYDWQLFNLQTMFLITGAKGTDREFYLPLNIDVDPLPFIRPAPQPVSVINHPPLIRMESKSLAPLGARRVPYRVPGHLLKAPGQYRLSFRMRMRTEPMYFMRFCESTHEMQQAMIDGTLDFHQSSVAFEVR